MSRAINNSELSSNSDAATRRDEDICVSVYITRKFFPAAFFFK